jgi:hypothetical protein
MSFLGRKGLTLLPSPDAISPSGSVHDKLELELELDPDASKFCTIIFPWGKYSYKRLPIGIAGSPDIFRGKMSELMES